jgi:hypothetical protein
MVELASRLGPQAGTAVLGLLLGLYACLAIAAVVLFLRWPKPLVPPESDQGPPFALFLDALRRRLAANPRLRGHDLADREGIERALETLGQDCDGIIRDTATTVFVSTAISQSGRLDTLFVLAAQGRMVWRIARTYLQRPALRDLLNLYANVAATALVAGELDDAELGEQIEPVLSSAFGALSLSVPGVQAAASIIVAAILTGAANSFFTLRVGIIAKRYCSTLVAADRAALRRSATAEAARLLGSIVKGGTARISKGLWQASKNKVGGAVSGLTGFAGEFKEALLALLKGNAPGQP